VTAIQLIAGLGNPGSKYEQTRHNAGFWFVDAVARRYDAGFRAESRYKSDVARCRIDGHDCRLQKPMDFMNCSGMPVASLAAFYRIPRQAILVVHDELDLPPGTVRLKKGGGHGGHNGLRDLIPNLGGNDFMRLRIGIGHPGDASQVINYVLHKPSAADLAAIEAANRDTLAVMPLVFEGRIDKAMQALHT